MSWGDVLDNALRFQLVRDFAPGPLADGASRFGRSLARQRRHLTALLGSKLGGDPGPGCLLQPLGYAQGLQIDPLQARPAVSPQPHGIDADRHQAGNLHIGGPLSRR